MRNYQIEFFSAKAVKGSLGLSFGVHLTFAAALFSSWAAPSDSEGDSPPMVTYERMETTVQDVKATQSPEVSPSELPAEDFVPEDPDFTEQFADASLAEDDLSPTRMPWSRITWSHEILPETVHPPEVVDTAIEQEDARPEPVTAAGIEPVESPIIPAMIDPKTCPSPVFPERAMERGLEGRVILAVDIDRSGQPTTVTVQQGSGHRMFDLAALRSVEKWTFKPATRDSHPVASSRTVSILFSNPDRPR